MISCLREFVETYTNAIMADPVNIVSTELLFNTNFRLMLSHGYSLAMVRVYTLYIQFDFNIKPAARAMLYTGI